MTFNHLNSISCWWVGALLCASLSACSIDSTVQDEIENNNRTPMAFGTTITSSESSVTRGAATLEADFKVGTWKNFNQINPQVVMDGYKVEYTSDATTNHWNYEGVNGQVLRYWDLSAFPYEFRAVSPYFKGATITNTGLNIDLSSNPSSNPFQAQIFIDGKYNVDSQDGEPCVVAQVSRQKNGTEYEDRDKIKNEEINKNEKANAVRKVHMPFHHLISKVGFRIFIDEPQPSSTDYHVTLMSVKISVVNAENQFITSSKSYTATNEQGLIHGTFTKSTTATGEFTLLEHGKYTDNLCNNLSRDKALDLCPDYIQQIPQQNIQIHVQVVIQTDHMVNNDVVDYSDTITYDRVLNYDKTSATGDRFTWEPDTRYIYYLHIPDLHNNDITLDTCEILPWDEVQSSDITVEL